MDDRHSAGSRRDDVASLLALSGPRAAPPADSAARVRQSVHDAWRQDVRRRRWRRTAAWCGAALAASVALIVAGRGFAPGPGRPGAGREGEVTLGVVEHVLGPATLPSRGEETVAIGQSITSSFRIRTGAQGYATLRLGRGTFIRLDADTVLGTPDESLIVLDRGAIYVDSGPDEPGLEVRTAAGTARDIGTRFEARLASTGLRVRVRAGRVRLDHAGYSDEAAAGIELQSTGAGPLLRRPVPLHGSEWNWTLRAIPAFPIEGQTLDAFLRWVEREGGWRVKVADPAIERTASGVVLHGSIEGLSPADALAVVLPTCGLTHRVSGDDVVIERD